MYFQDSFIPFQYKITLNLWNFIIGAQLYRKLVRLIKISLHVEFHTSSLCGSCLVWLVKNMNNKKWLNYPMLRKSKNNDSGTTCGSAYRCISTWMDDRQVLTSISECMYSLPGVSVVREMHRCYATHICIESE